MSQVIELYPRSKPLLKEVLFKLRWAAEREEDGSVLLTPLEAQALLEALGEYRLPLDCGKPGRAAGWTASGAIVSERNVSDSHTGASQDRPRLLDPARAPGSTRGALSEDQR